MKKSFPCSFFCRVLISSICKNASSFFCVKADSSELYVSVSSIMGVLETGMVEIRSNFFKKHIEAYVKVKKIIYFD